MPATTTLGPHDAATAAGREAPEHRNGLPEDVTLPDGVTATEDGAAVTGRSRFDAVAPVAPVVPSHILEEPKHDERHALAMFCREAPDGLVGRFAAKLAAAVAGRDTPVHIFSRHDFGVEAEGVHVHALGGADEGDLLERSGTSRTAPATPSCASSSTARPSR
jgi:hypothetical protein